MKTKILVQFGAKDVDVKDIEKAVKEDLKAKEVVLNKLETLDIYYKASSKDKKEYRNQEAVKVAD